MLIVCDNFWIGGRETFINDSLHILRKHGLQRAYLIANSIKNSRVQDIFDDYAEVNAEDANDVRAWLEANKKLSTDNDIDLVWVQHYSGLPGLFLAQHWRAKLHITLHGPPLSSALLSKNDALGLALSADRGATLSGVSPEILAQVREFSTNASHQLLLLNRVRCPTNLTVNSVQLARKDVIIHNPIKMALFTRQGKLDHIRAACKLLAAFTKQGFSGQLTIYTGITSELGIASKSTNQWTLRTTLLGRKWLAHNLDVLCSLKKIIVRPLTNEVPKAIQSSDIVMGMGRVVLEGLANRKVSILIGYTEVVGVVNAESFSQYQETNFSGRKQKTGNIFDVAKDAVQQLSAGQNEFDLLQANVDLNNSWAQFEVWANAIAASASLQPCERCSELLNRLDAQHEQSVPSDITELLNTKEQSTFLKLTEINQP